MIEMLDVVDNCFVWGLFDGELVIVLRVDVMCRSLRLSGVPGLCVVMMVIGVTGSCAEVSELCCIVFHSFIVRFTCLQA